MAAPLYLQWSIALQTNNGSLRNWKRSNNRIIFSCPMCGDSHDDPTKARCNIHEYKQTLIVSCYNCGASISFEKFLREYNSTLYKQFKLETIGNGTNSGYSRKDSSQLIESKAEKFLKTEVLDNQWKKVFSKPRGEAYDYLRSRKIPIDSNILWANNFRNSIIDLYELYGLDVDEMSPCKEEGRIIFPFLYDNVLTYIQGRSIDSSIDKRYRYMTMEINGGNKVYGHEKLTKDGAIYVTEGPIDSLFVGNGIAVADANLTRASQFVDKSRLVCIFDNEPRSTIAIGKLEGALRSGYKVVIFPDYVVEKDLNEMVLAGRDVKELVGAYQYSGPAGLLRLNKWKKA